MTLGFSYEAMNSSDSSTIIPHGRIPASTPGDNVTVQFLFYCIYLQSLH